MTHGEFSQIGKEIYSDELFTIYTAKKIRHILFCNFSTTTFLGYR